MLKKGADTDLAILEKLPPMVDLRLLVDQFGHYKQPRKKVFDLAQKNYLELVCRGHYLNLKARDFKVSPPEGIANALYFPSYVSAEWALQHYGLLTDRVYTITSVTPRKSVSFKTSLGVFEFCHLHKHRYSFGYEVDSHSGFLMARPEKALLDYLKLRDHDMTWRTSREMEEYLEGNVRLHLSDFFDQVSADNLREMLPHYHRNSVEARIIKWWLVKKEIDHG
ncbi:hypothetical protein WDW86_04040 [Bdellovibrionota bacterium FG-2]